MASIRILLVLALAIVPTQMQAQRMVCGPNGCSYVRTPVASAIRPQATVYRAASPRIVSRYQTTQPVVRYERRGLFGRRVVAVRYSQATSTSYGSSGSTAVVQSYGSSGGYQSQPAPQSYGSSGGYNQPAAEVETLEATPPTGDQSSNKSCPCGDDCQCKPFCDCTKPIVATLPTGDSFVVSLPSSRMVVSLPAEPLTLVAMR